MSAVDLDLDQALQLLEEDATSQQAAEPSSEGLGRGETLQDLYDCFRQDLRPQPDSESLPLTQAAPASTPCLQPPQQVLLPQEPAGMSPTWPGKVASS
jgi:hypothetical protein